VSAAAAAAVDRADAHRETPTSLLTAREHEVLRLVAQRLSSAEIAGALLISPRTVERHLENIFAKLGVASRREAATEAARRGLV
jgi:DNA-binding CsgD family transcriptional regulator